MEIAAAATPVNMTALRSILHLHDKLLRALPRSGKPDSLPLPTNVGTWPQLNSRTRLKFRDWSRDLVRRAGRYMCDRGGGLGHRGPVMQSQRYFVLPLPR